ncbi:Uncharacterized protein SCF082_LOCUS47170, partial [Durusdinium trenchii]
PGKVAWTRADVQTLAIQVKQGLPLEVTQLLTSDGFAGGALVQVDTLSSARAEDLVLNYHWVRPFVQHFRDRVPSGFFVADVFLFLDTLYQGKALRPTSKQETKESMAAEEGKRTKILIGCLRALWRSSAQAIACRASAEQPPDHDGQSLDLDGPAENDVGPSRSDSESGDEECPPPLEGPPSKAEGDDESCSGSTTLELPGNDTSSEYEGPSFMACGEKDDFNETPHESSAEEASGQSPSAQSPVEKTPEKTNPWCEELFNTPMTGNSGPNRAEIVEMCIALMEFFSKEHPDIMKNFNLVPYLDHCEWSFARFGVRASSWLSTREYWDSWLARYEELGNKVLTPEQSRYLVEDDASPLKKIMRKNAFVKEGGTYLGQAKGLKRALALGDEQDGGAPKKPKKPKLVSQASCAAFKAVEVLLRNKAYVLRRVGAADGNEAESTGASLKGFLYPSWPTYFFIQEAPGTICKKRGRMPFKQDRESKATTWKDKQRACVFAGLRAMRAPAVQGKYKEDQVEPYGKQRNPDAESFNEYANKHRKLVKASEMVVHYTDSNGLQRIKGGSDLKQSQAYPLMFFGLI